MRLYIDPGTGSMLFAILIGILGAVGYMFKSWMVKLRFLLHGGKRVEAESRRIPLAIFSDDKRYWSVFRPVCEELDRRGVNVVYLTASPDDPVLTSPYAHIRGEFIGKGNKAFAKLNFLNADILLSTTPGLDVYQWKRSKGVKYYVHMLHAANEVTGYRMFGIDYYDAILLSGDYQIRDLRALETLRGLPAKEAVKIGIPYMDAMRRRLEEDAPTPPHERTVLLAPSWGESAILKKYGGRIFRECSRILSPFPCFRRIFAEHCNETRARTPTAWAQIWYSNRMLCSFFMRRMNGGINNGTTVRY